MRSARQQAPVRHISLDDWRAAKTWHSASSGSSASRSGGADTVAGSDAEGIKMEASMAPSCPVKSAGLKSTPPNSNSRLARCSTSMSRTSIDAYFNIYSQFEVLL